MLRVNEIFYSVQGEGHYTGTPSAFIRLSGCNLHCSFCDTEHLAHTNMTEEDIVAQVCEWPMKHVVITGGEPTMQNIAPLIRLLIAEGKDVQIETNGTYKLGEDFPPCWITCSPKDGGEVKLERIDELKVVYWGQNMSKYDHLKANIYSLQPLDTGDTENNKEITKKTFEYILEHPTWKMSLQTHKILEVR